MKYIIMCGGEYRNWPQPKQLSLIKDEPIIARTIRLLRENGVEDIAISSDNPVFEQFGVPVLNHENTYVDHVSGFWADCFYPMSDPCCYIMGDVVFSPRAINTIVNTKTDDIEFFGSAKPFMEGYLKPWVEPFAFKVADQAHFRDAIEEMRHLHEVHQVFWRHPIAWELWEVIKKTPINKTITNYTVINDYTCDVDEPEDIEKFNKLLRRFL